MIGRTKILYGLLALTGATSPLAVRPAQAGHLPPPPPPPSVIICNCDPHNVVFDDATINGNVQVGDTGGFVGTTGTITGTLSFAGAQDAVSFNPGNVSIGNVVFSDPTVQSNITTLNALSQGFADQNGTRTTIAGGGSINASDGVLVNGTNVFTATLGSFPAGSTFTVNGTSDQSVVINIPQTGTLNFDGSVVLTGGITPDNVLFNFDAGDYSNNTGGPNLLLGTPLIETSSFAMQSLSDPLTTGTFLDPNGPIDITDIDLVGRIYGGDQSDLLISGSVLTDPDLVPEPSSLALLGAGIIGVGIIRRRQRAFSRRSAVQ
jgi:PEP-CTERM motif